MGLGCSSNTIGRGRHAAQPHVSVASGSDKGQGCTSMYSVTKNKEQEYFLAMYACIYPSSAKPRPVPCFFNPLVTLSTPVLLSSLCLQRHLLPGQHRQHLHVNGATHPRRRGAVPAVEVPHVRGLEERVVPGLQSPHRSMCCVPPHLSARLSRAKIFTKT